MARSQPGTTTPPTDRGCWLGVFIRRRERDLTQNIRVNMQFLMSIAGLGFKPISSVPVLARKTRRAEDGCPSARSYTVVPIRSGLYGRGSAIGDQGGNL